MKRMEQLLQQLLARQDPAQKHSWLTRGVVSFILLFAHCVLYGFYGVIGSVVMYLVGVELAGLELKWMFLPFAIMLAYGFWKSVAALTDYWRNHGHGET